MQIVKSSTVTWVDVVRPTNKDIHLLMHEFNVHPLAATQLKDPTSRPVVENFDTYLYVVLHFPIFNEERQTSQSVEVDFVITPSMLLTARYSTVVPLEAILKRCSFVPRKNAALCMDKGPMFLFYYIVKELFNFSQREIDHIHEKVNTIEEGIFEGKEREMLIRISRVRRDIINFTSALKPQRMVLENLLRREDFVDSYTRPYIIDLLTEYDKIFNLITAKRETIEALQQTNESLLNVKTNEAIKTLSIMAFLTFPLALITAILGLDTQTRFIVGREGDLWIIIGLLGAVALGFFTYFKKKGWI